MYYQIPLTRDVGPVSYTHLFWLAGFLARFWGWLAGRAFSLARTARFLLKISWRFCLITTVRFWRGCQKSNFGVEFYLIQWKSFFVPFHIRKAENPWKQRLSALFTGVHKRIWTSDPTLRRRVLYPAELYGRVWYMIIARPKSNCNPLFSFFEVTVVTQP